MKIVKKISIVFLLFIIYILLSIYSYSNAVSNTLSNNIFRLHVIANSDSKDDQLLKYKIRDELISYMNSISSNISTKEEAIALANENIDTFQTLAKRVIEENGFNYNVTVEIGNFNFPTKQYGDISLPSGYYDALKVKIGNSSGQNWWCVMFPSLCFIDVSNGFVPDESKENLKLNLDEEEYNLISSEKNEYKVKFKIVELFENTKIRLANNK